MNLKIENTGDTRTLKTKYGTGILQTSLFPTKGIVYVHGEWITKAQLEELLRVKIIETKDVPKIEPVTSKTFEVDGARFGYNEEPDTLRVIAVRYLAAADEIERHAAEKKAEAEKEAEAERIKAAEAEGKKRREIAAIAAILMSEGSFEYASDARETAESLYAAGVRKVD